MSGSIQNSGSSVFFILFNKTFVFQITFVLFVYYLPNSSTSFSFRGFNPNEVQDLDLQNDAGISSGAIELTKSTAGTDFGNSVGRASYNKSIPLWNKRTNRTTNFTTHFKFKITRIEDDKPYGDGFAFFLMPFNGSIGAPKNSYGGCLGLVGGAKQRTCNIYSYPFVAVEFDTFHNKAWDPSNGTDHVGIDVNKIKSEVVWRVNGGLKRGTSANAWINYDSSIKNLSVYLTYDDDPVFKGEYNLSYTIDLRDILPEKVRVGFSSGTGLNYERHTILFWEFNSTFVDDDENTSPTPSSSKAALVGGLVAGGSVLAIGLLGLIVWWRRRSRGSSTRSNNYDTTFTDDDDFDQETGPKRFTYNELSRATNNFSEGRKLGEGGFGGVYRGLLTGHNSREIAVKKISRGSKQGKKEYVSEVKIISRLRHKNLVQLIGWCHEQGNLLLVYEFMANGSLDSYLYAHEEKGILQWVARYKIAHDLASALFYLHQEWEQCVLHRDIKSSNVMLDSNFNAKLGDFGLARLVDHNLSSQTTVLAGTLGYLAPECFMIGKFSKPSDVYSFGVVALEIACGRQPIVESKEEPSKVKMIEWVWHLYGEGRLLEAVDDKLQGEFDTTQIQCLMLTGLWCCHPDHTYRPSIRQVINVLNLESPLPNLPIKFPVPVYYSSQMNVSYFHTSSSLSSGLTGSTNSSSQSVVHGAAPLLSDDNVIA